MLEYLRIWYIFEGLPPFAKIFWGLLFLFFFLTPLIVRLRRDQDRKLYEQMKPLTDLGLDWVAGICRIRLVEAVITHWNWHEPFFGNRFVVARIRRLTDGGGFGLLPSVPVFFKTERLIKEAQALNMDAPFKTRPGFWAGVYMVVFILMVTSGILGGFLLKDWLVRLF
jgi:hypothetical protein